MDWSPTRSFFRLPPLGEDYASAIGAPKGPSRVARAARPWTGVCTTRSKAPIGATSNGCLSMSPPRGLGFHRPIPGPDGPGYMTPPLRGFRTLVFNVQKLSASTCIFPVKGREPIQCNAHRASTRASDNRNRDRALIPSAAVAVAATPVATAIPAAASAESTGAARPSAEEP
jgi:hypothetical protein